MIRLQHIITACFLFSIVLNAQETHKRTLKLMGSRFDITVVALNEEDANQYIDVAVEEIKRKTQATPSELSSSVQHLVFQKIS